MEPRRFVRVQTILLMAPYAGIFRPVTRLQPMAESVGVDVRVRGVRRVPRFCTLIQPCDVMGHLALYAMFFTRLYCRISVFYQGVVYIVSGPSILGRGTIVLGMLADFRRRVRHVITGTLCL